VKPILLELSNFGPYVGAPVRIEFDQLERLFLIAGDTGSGKTTLFDAMCYALYGVPLGTREERSLRSHLADEKDSTFVTFVFEAGGQRWKVERSPYAVRSKQRGAGVVIDQSAKLFRSARGASSPTDPPVWEPFNLKRGEINAKIEHEILHISHEEFSKILVLPQGEFQRFLEMDTAERARILEKLFPTKLHDRIAALAKDKAAAMVKDVKDVEVRQEELRRTFEPDTFASDESTRVQSLVSLNEQRAVAGENAKAATAVKEASRALAKAFADLATGQEQVALLEADTAQVHALKGELDLSRKAQRVLPIVNQRDMTVRELAKKRGDADGAATKAREIEAQQQVLKPLVEALPEREVALREMEAEQTRAAERRRDLDDLSRLDREAGKASTALEKRRGEVLVLAKAEHTAGQQLKALTAYAQERETVHGAVSAALVEGKRLGQHAREVQTWKLWSTERPAAQRDLAKTTRAQEKLVDAEKTAAAEVKAARKRLDGEAALRLAGTLVEGKKCPVCGSLDHPRPAKGKNSDEDLHSWLESAESLLEARQSERQTASDLMTARQGAFTLREEHAAETQERLAGSGFASVAEWEQAAADNAAELQTRRGRESELKQLLAERPKLEEAEGQARAAREAKQTMVVEAEVAVAAVRAKLGTLVEKTGVADHFDTALAQVLASLSQRAAAIVAERGEIEKVRKRSSDLERSLDAERVREAELTVSIEALQQRLETLARELRDALATAGFATDEDARTAERSGEEQSALDLKIVTWASELQTARGHIQHLTGITVDRERPDLVALEQAERDATMALDASTTLLVTAEHELTELRKRKTRWQELLVEVDRLRTSGQAYLELSRDLNGENRGKLTFSTFIHTWWLEQVLDRGNSRFTRLSEGRYSFRANPEQSDGRKRSGLEIDVWDAHAASLRSVRTLSGGEKFMASLSLALGLSDVILERAGGIELDTLFIDEGFGSLDADALDRALAVLDEIGASRTVGVISHVEALKRSIPCQIRVEKGAAGSKVSVVRR
jgi:exonuclease SbcC